MAEFVDKLLLEIDKTAELVKNTGSYVENIYIGGGTPTTLTSEYFKMIFEKVCKFTNCCCFSHAIDTNDCDDGRIFIWFCMYYNWCCYYDFLSNSGFSL